MSNPLSPALNSSVSTAEEPFLFGSPSLEWGMRKGSWTGKTGQYLVAGEKGMAHEFSALTCLTSETPKASAIRLTRVSMYDRMFPGLKTILYHLLRSWVLLIKCLLYFPSHDRLLKKKLDWISVNCHWKQKSQNYLQICGVWGIEPGEWTPNEASSFLCWALKCVPQHTLSHWYLINTAPCQAS